MPDDERMGRRQFAEQFVVGSGALAILMASPSNSNADDQPYAKDKLNAKADAPGEPPVKPPLEILLLTYLIQKYPSENLDETAVKGIYGDLRGDLARGRILSEFPLKNSDEPALVFRAFRAAE